MIFKTNKNGITINEDTKADNHIEDFALKALYNCHKDKVLELIDISRAYNEASFENLVNEFAKSTQIFKDTNDIKHKAINNEIIKLRTKELIFLLIFLSF